MENNMSDQQHACPSCGKTFDDLHVVPSNSLEPYTSVDPMKGIMAYGILGTPSEIVCQADEWLHLHFPHIPEDRLIQMVIFDQQRLVDRHQYHANNSQPCETEGCDKEGNPCYMYGTDEEPNGWYCDDHQVKAGFCPGCGLFAAGTEAFDFQGLCASCLELSIINDDDWDEDDFDDDEFYDEDDE
jgi:hypothetical protein